MPGGDKVVAEIPPSLSENIHCLGITCNAQTNTSTFCKDDGRCASSRIFGFFIAATAYLRMQRLPAAASERTDVKCRQLRGTRGGRGHKRLARALSSQPIPILSPHQRHTPSPNALCPPGLVDIVHRARGRPYLPPPRNWVTVTAAGRWGA